MQYKIGDVARILGISTDLLRYYEKKGVVTPIKDKQNDYRYYDTWDINFLLDCLWYKSFGFGIPEIAYMECECYHGDLISVLEGKQDEMLESIRHQELLLHRLREHCEQVIHAREFKGQCDIAYCPEVIRYFNRFDTSYDFNPEKQKLAKQWLAFMPFLQRYFEIPGTVSGEHKYRYAWGFSIDMKYVEEFSVPVKQPVEHLPSVECVHSFFKSSGKNAFTADHINYLYDYAKENGYTVTGSARGNLVCSILEDGLNTGYFEVWLPIAR